MKSNLTLRSLKGNLLSKDELSKLKEIEALIPEYEGLLRTRSKVTGKLKELNNMILVHTNSKMY